MSSMSPMPISRPAAGKPMARLRTIGSGSDSSSGGDQVRELEFEAVNQYAAMVDSFSHSVRTGRLVEPAEDGLAQMRVLDRLIGAAGTIALNR